jgi:N-acetylglucosamine-6-sulfatase
MRMPATPTLIRILAERPASSGSARPRRAEPIHRRRTRHRLVAVAAIAATSIVIQVARSPVERAAALPRTAVPATTASGPNVVLIVTDDQRVGTLDAMPAVRRLLGRRGTRFTHAIASNPLCCPSRASILTGRYSHGTGVYANWGSAGGWPAFDGSGAESSTIATALDDAGYTTGLFGKYMNRYPEAPSGYVPPGWDRWFVFAEENGAYYDYATFDSQRGTQRHGSAPPDYSTDVIRRRAVSFIRDTPSTTPFFAMITPYAPHGPATAAPRHDGTFGDEPIPIGPGLSENVADKPSYIRQQRASDPVQMIERARDQLETLSAVDGLVRQVVDVLRSSERLGQTLFIFTSDNGMSNGEHRWRTKVVPYEESIRVPLLVRFDGQVLPDVVRGTLAANVDIAPTIADYAGVTLSGAEGRSLRPVLQGSASQVRDAVLLEHLQFRGLPVPTYCGIRTRRFMYTWYATGEHELYDLSVDPHQLTDRSSSRAYRAERRSLDERLRGLCDPAPPGFAFP